MAHLLKKHEVEGQRTGSENRTEDVDNLQVKRKCQVEEDGKFKDDSQGPSRRCRKSRVSGKTASSEVFWIGAGRCPGS